MNYLDDLFEQKSNTVKVKHKRLQGIINENVRKFSGFAIENGLSSEDLSMFAIHVLLDIIKIREVDTLKPIEFTTRDIRYYETALGRRMRDYANQDILIKRKSDEEGKRKNVYCKLSPMHYFDDDFSIGLEFDENAKSLTLNSTYKYFKSPFGQFVEGNKNKVLTKSQLAVYNTLIDNNGDVMATALALGKHDKSVYRTIESISKRLEQAYLKQNSSFPSTNRITSNYRKEYNEEIKRKYEKQSECSTVKVYDMDGNFLREEAPKLKKTGSKYAKIDANGAEIPQNSYI